MIRESNHVDYPGRERPASGRTQGRGDGESRMWAWIIGAIVFTFLLWILVALFAV